MVFSVHCLHLLKRKGNNFCRKNKLCVACFCFRNQRIINNNNNVLKSPVIVNRTLSLNTQSLLTCVDRYQSLIDFKKGILLGNFYSKVLEQACKVCACKFQKSKMSEVYFFNTTLQKKVMRQNGKKYNAHSFYTNLQQKKLLMKTEPKTVRTRPA